MRDALEETMVTAFHQIRQRRSQRGIPGLRTAAVAFAIDRVARSYLAQGIFP